MPEESLSTENKLKTAEVVLRELLERLVTSREHIDVVIAAGIALEDLGIPYGSTNR